jgi:ADP-heptose:LPS heptosyltransferase
MSPPSQTENPNRILLVRLGGFGDVIFTLPAVHLLRTAFPESQISFLVYKEFAPLLEGFPGVNTVLTLDRRPYRTLNPFSICAHTGSLLSQLARARFGLAVDFQGFGETGFFCWFTRAPQRWGSIYRPGRKWAYTDAVSRNTQLHPIDYHLDLLQQAGGLVVTKIHNEFVPPKAALEEARVFFARHQLEVGRPTLFIQPFTSSQHKSWPLEHFLTTARLWQKRGVQVVFGGGPGDKAALAPASEGGFAVAAGAPPLVSAGLVKLSTLVLGGDTGLLHLAAAMGKRVVMIMRSLHPGACFPFGHREWAIVPPDGLHVMALSSEAVHQACSRAFAELDVKLIGSSSST